jgi:hypothetical protein
MREVRDDKIKGSILVGAVVLTFALTLSGVAYLSFASTLTEAVSSKICLSQAYYNSISGAAQGMADDLAGQISYTGMKEFYPGSFF